MHYTSTRVITTLMKNKIVDFFHTGYAFGGIIRYSLFYKKLFLIGVTGTDGKSSTVEFTAKLLRTAGIKTAHYSSININDSLNEVGNASKMTTPGRAGVHRFLAQSARSGATHAVIEITSEGIKQHRHLGVVFDRLVYTNISPEHIERHGSFKKYIKTKMSLLHSLKKDVGIVLWNCSDDELRKRQYLFQKYPNVPVITNGKKEKDPFVEINYRMALETARSLGVEAELTSTEKQLPGRFECLLETPRVFVDYAHTPVALEMCLTSIRKNEKGRIIHVFGAAGGGRDAWKRPILAKISEKYADIHILTEENSFDEPFEHIAEDIKKGFSPGAEVYVFSKREEAVKKAFSFAKRDDVIVCTAKGSEVVIAGPNGTMRGYNERVFIKQCLS